MIEKLSVKISAFWVNGNVIQQDDAEIYEYGMQLVLSTIANVLLIMLISVIVRLPLVWLPFLIAFIPLRTTAGGYHARTHFFCILSFCTTFFIFIMLIKTFTFFSTEIYLSICAVGSLALIFGMSPVQASNKPLTKDEAVRNRTKSLVIATFFMIPMILAIAIPALKGEYIAAFYSGELSAALSLVVAKMRNRIYKIKEN